MSLNSFRQHYLDEPTKLIDTQLDHLAVVVFEPDALPVILGILAVLSPGQRRRWMSSWPAWPGQFPCGIVVDRRRLRRELSS
jgi:hypothetical protein